MSAAATPAYDVLADAIDALGVPVVFGVVGEDLVVLVAALVARPGISYHAARHESAAVCMAQGYARATGGLGLCVVSRGPGFTNALTGLVQCRKARVPVLAFVGGAPAGAPEPVSGVAAAKHVPQAEFASAARIELVHVDVAETAARTVADAALRAREGRPVVVQVALDLELPVTRGPAAPIHQEAPSIRTADRVGPSAAAVEQTAQLLAASERPLIVAGRGAHLAGARDALTELAERSGAFLGTSLLAKGLFSGHPRDIGIVGGFSHGPGRAVVEQTDCVLAFGASLNLFTAGMGRLFIDADVCQFTLEPEPTGLRTPPIVVERADAREAAKRIGAAIRDDLTARWPEEIAAAVRDYRPLEHLIDRSGPGGADPEVLLCALDEALPSHRSVVLDGGHFTGAASMYLQVPDPDHFFYGLDFAAVGVGHPTGLGVAVARPDELTVVVVGDGGLLMTLGELDAARASALPLVIVVMNDAAYGAEVHFLHLRGLNGDVAALPPQDFAAIAASMGMNAAIVRTPEEALEAAQIGPLTAPLLLDCRIDPTLRANWLDDLFR